MKTNINANINGKGYQNQLFAFNSLVKSLEKLPTIGKKSAKKMAFTLAVENSALGLQISQAIQECILEIRKCDTCGALSVADICNICLDSDRKNGTLCIVSHPKDIFLIEDLGEFNGVYCVIADYQSYDFDTLIKRIKSENINEIIFAFAPSLEGDIAIMFIQERLEERLTQRLARREFYKDEIDTKNLADGITTEFAGELTEGFANNIEENINGELKNDEITSEFQNLTLKFSKIAQGVPSNISLDNIDNLSLARAFSSRVDA